MNIIELRDCLKEIWEVDDKHLLEMSTSLYVPTIDRNDKVGTWIGYRFMKKEKYMQAYKQGDQLCVPTRVWIRQVFVGPHAEELADNMLTWGDRQDVKEIFEKIQAQIMYNGLEVVAYSLRNEGFNDGVAWICDIPVQTIVGIDMHYVPWFTR